MNPSSLRRVFTPPSLFTGITRFLVPANNRHITTTMRYFHLSQGRVLQTGSPLDLPEPPAV